MAKILLVAPAVAREGITKQIANQIIGLQQEQVNVCLVVLAKSNIGILKEYGVDITTVPILQLHQPTSYLSLRAFLGSTQTVWPILRYLKAQRITSVIAHAPYAHFVMRLAKLVAPLFGLTFILAQYFHGLQYSEYPINTRRRYAMNSLNKWLAKRCDNVHISVSEIVRLEIMQHLVKLPNHAVLCNSLTISNSWNGMAEIIWQRVQLILQQTRAKYRILIPNRIDYNKGQLFFLNVLEEFFRVNNVPATDIAMFVVGDGPQKQEMEAAVRLKGLEETVLLLGELPNAVVQKLMQHVQLVVVPSFMEGLPFTVLEGLRAKCIVLAAHTGGIPEIIKDRETGFLFKTGGVKDCVEQLYFVYSHRHKTLIDGKVIDEVVQNKLSLRKNTEKLLQIVSTTNNWTAK